MGSTDKLGLYQVPYNECFQMYLQVCKIVL
jgi:hypothetical protein